MKRNRSALSAIAIPPPNAEGTIQFFDGIYPALDAGTYTIAVTQNISTTESGAPAPYQTSQQFTVVAPEFTIDPGAVLGVYPPDGSSGPFDENLAFIVLSDPSLPFERTLIPGQAGFSTTNPTWLALLLFAPGELILPAGTTDPVTTTTVGDFLAVDPNGVVLKPAVTATTEMQGSQCQTITLYGETFKNVLPSVSDVYYLAHCRAMNTGSEPAVVVSSLLSNRLAVARNDPVAPVSYSAHLVSLEGFSQYMSPNGSVPQQTAAPDQLMNVQMISLYHWTFTSIPSTDLFTAMMQQLVASQAATPALALPPLPETTPAATAARINDGYVALRFVAGSGEETFAWYRGPFTAQPPEQMPLVGPNNVALSNATSAEELMIYDQAAGVFDLSYAAAWNIARGLALADSGFAQAVIALAQAATAALVRIAQRRGMRHLSGVASAVDLVARNATRRQFGRSMAEGLGERWTDALRNAHQGVHAPRRAVRTMRRRKQTIHPRTLLEDPEVVEAIAGTVEDPLLTVAIWLANLISLEPIPFSYLVPDPRMLPAGSIRFFYLDDAWLEALIGGAMSIGATSESASAVLAALRPRIDAAVRNSGASTTTVNYNGGMLIRSELVSAWSTIVLTITGSNVSIARDVTLSPSVRLVQFEGVPDTVTFAQPYQGLQFGIEAVGIPPRSIAEANAGQQLEAAPVAPVLRPTLTPFVIGGVVEITSTAGALAAALGATSIGPGDFALQMVKLPESQSFPS